MDRKTIIDLYTKNWILNYYPFEKQKSDDTDWLNYTTYLVYHYDISIDKIAKIIYGACADIIDGKSNIKKKLKEIISTTGINEKDVWLQLIKVGLRKGWVRLIKEIARRIYEDKSIPDDEIYYVVNKEFIPLYEEVR